MTPEELSNGFDLRVDAYRRMKAFDSQAMFDSIEFDEYEKSVFLTRAQKDFVVSFYTGKNQYGYSFEEKEIIRQALDTLVVTVKLNEVSERELCNKAEHLEHDNHTFSFYHIPDNLLYTIFEEVRFSSYISDCNSEGVAVVIPTTHDELWYKLHNPFRGTSKSRVLRLNAADNIVELVSDYPIGSYLLRYVEEPKPIILIDLSDGLTIDGISEKTGCKLPDITHSIILDNAVALALQSKFIGVASSAKDKD